jgi:predicted nucleic-acid-binding protein
LRITPDTDILVRIAVVDDPDQAREALDLLRDAKVFVLTPPALCEFVWVVRRGYRRPVRDIPEAVLQLTASATVRVDRPAVEAGVAMLLAGGDFADGIIAFEGRRLGGDVFASFDRKAVDLVAAQGGDTHLAGPSRNKIAHA